MKSHPTCRRSRRDSVAMTLHSAATSEGSTPFLEGERWFMVAPEHVDSFEVYIK